MTEQPQQLSDSNNNATISNENSEIEVAAMKKLSISDTQQTVGNHRVSTWLAHSRKISENPSDPKEEEEQVQQQQHSDDEAADEEVAQLGVSTEDSGRASSVDTEPNCSSSNCDSASTSNAAAAMVAGKDQDGSAEEQQEARGAVSAIVRGASPIPGDDNDVIHQFLIPNRLGGAMVGTRGRNINYIRAKSGASVWISRNFFDKRTQIVNVRGPVDCVRSALQVIKKRFPELDVKPINTAVPIQRNPALQPTMCQLSLPVGALVDVNICAMCRGTTLFMQQPSHPSFHHLEKMDCSIMKHYADHESVPSLPRPVNPGAVCVAPFGDSWHRAIIADVFPEDDIVLMKYLDWGGYEKMPVSCLKQIRTEMMHLPFQSVEGHLAYVTPILSGDGQSAESELERISSIIHSRYLGNNMRIRSQVMYYNNVGQPCVYLYAREGPNDQWRFVQEELVQAGLVQWFQLPNLLPQPPAQLPPV